MAANGDVGLDIEHHHVLAVANHGEGKTGADVGIAGGVNRHVDGPAGRQRREILGDCKFAPCHGLGHGARRGHHRQVIAAIACKQGGVHGALRLGLGHRAKPEPRHAAELHNEIGAHLPRPGKPHGNGPSGLLPGLEFGHQGRHIGNHQSTPASQGLLIARTAGSVIRPKQNPTDQEAVGSGSNQMMPDQLRQSSMAVI